MSSSIDQSDKLSVVSTKSKKGLKKRKYSMILCKKMRKKESEKRHKYELHEQDSFE